ncbi:MAG: hypothetical protein ACM3MI_02855 [Clostridiales bacterium]
MEKLALRKALQDFIEPTDRKCCLLSVRPIYVNRIVEGSKRYEYRKKCFSREVSKVFIYSSHPIQKIVGCFLVSQIIYDSPQYIWGLTKDSAGIDLDSFESYSKGRSHIFAIRVENFNAFTVPINPYELVKNFVPPQSYMYI